MVGRPLDRSDEGRDGREVDVAARLHASVQRIEPRHLTVALRHREHGPGDPPQGAPALGPDHFAVERQQELGISGHLALLLRHGTWGIEAEYPEPLSEL